jgi:Domain of unknown function (DUF4118)
MISARRPLVATLLPVVVAFGLVPLRGHVSAANLALVLVLAVLAGAVIGGRVAGVVGGVVAAAAFDYLLTVPYGSFSIDRRDDVVTTVLLAVVGMVGGELIERARRSEAEAAARRAQLARFERRAELAAGGEPPARLIVRTGEELVAILHLVDARYEAGPAPRDLALLTHWGATIPGDRRAGEHDVVALPVRAHGRDLGHFRLVFPRQTAGMGGSADARHDAVAVADQLGMALLRFDRPV